MPATTEILLAGGLWRGARCERLAVLQAPGAERRRELLDALEDALPAERVTAFLEACLCALGDVTPVGADDLRALRIGDRDMLVLALRGLIVGDRVKTVFSCTQDGCREVLEVELLVPDLLAAVAGPLPQEATDGPLRVRAATGADHERAARRAIDDPVAAAEAFLSDCVLDGTAGGADPGQIATMLAEIDPAADLLMETQCPACGATVAASLDPIAHLWHELEVGRAQLEHDVHRLAWHYHWSEAEILALGDGRRARYLDQLDRELGVA